MVQDVRLERGNRPPPTPHTHTARKQQEIIGPRGKNVLKGKPRYLGEGPREERAVKRAWQPLEQTLALPGSFSFCLGWRQFITLPAWTLQ